jgi:hypothetical protein
LAARSPAADQRLRGGDRLLGDAKFSQALINAADAMAPTLATMLDAA